MLEERGLAPRKSFGQNFLVDHNLICKLVDAAAVGDRDVVLEVGPGTGTLTEELLARGCRVIAAEIDRGMCELLRERLGGNPLFTLVEGDCLDGKHAFAPALVSALLGAMAFRPAGSSFTLVANLPYGCATPVMMVLMAGYPACRGIFVTIQKEVGDRLMARPGTKEYGPLTVLALATCEVERVATLPPGCFWPRPSVTSAMISLRRRAAPQHPDPSRLLAFCHRLFEHRRKQIGSILGRDRAFPDGISPTDRAEALSLGQLMELERTP